MKLNTLLLLQQSISLMSITTATTEDAELEKQNTLKAERANINTHSRNRILNRIIFLNFQRTTKKRATKVNNDGRLQATYYNN